MPAPGEAHPTRRGGARLTVSERVVFKRDQERVHDGWALNVSKGGVRAILDVEDGRTIELGEEYDVEVGPASSSDVGTARRGRIVWLQEEPDGFVVGVEYVGEAPSEAGPGEGDRTSEVD
jgi:hypothetical protein